MIKDFKELVRLGEDLTVTLEPGRERRLGNRVCTGATSGEEGKGVKP